MCFTGVAACGDGSGNEPSGLGEPSVPQPSADTTDRIGKSRGGLTPLVAEGGSAGGSGGNAGGSTAGGSTAGGGGGMTPGGMGGVTQGTGVGGAGGSAAVTAPVPPKPETEGTPTNVTTVMAKGIKTKLLIADIIYTKQIKLRVARIGEMTESKQDKRYELSNGSPDISQSTVRATVVYAEDIEADEVQAKQLFAHQIQYF